MSVTLVPVAGEADEYVDKDRPDDGQWGFGQYLMPGQSCHECGRELPEDDDGDTPGYVAPDGDAYCCDCVTVDVEEKEEDE